MQDNTVYVLMHEYELDGYDTLKILGVYSERALAESAQARFAGEDGFRDHPDGFGIVPPVLDREMWSGGFFTYRYPLEN